MRPVLIALASIGLVLALLADLVVGVQFLPPTIVAGAVLLALIFENRRYKALLDARPGPDWQATGERFVVTESGKTVTVYFNADTGERRYVAAPFD